MAAIKRLIPGCPWNYIEAVENPAVMAATGMNAEEILADTRWWHGPALVSKFSNSWMVWQAAPELSAEVMEAVECEQKPVTIGTIQLPYWWISERYSDLSVMSTMVAIVRKCVIKWRQNVERKRSSTFENILDDEGVTVSRNDAKIGLPGTASGKVIDEQWLKLRRKEVIRKEITKLTREEVINGEKFW